MRTKEPLDGKKHNLTCMKGKRDLLVASYNWPLRRLHRVGGNRVDGSVTGS